MGIQKKKSNKLRLYCLW